MPSSPLTRSPRAHEAQGATFVELFFDLVFVFAVTQTAALLHDELTLAGVGRALLIFWLVWWAWTQFTWTLNPADCTDPRVRNGTLAAAAVAFPMALTVPEAFSDGVWWFALSYIVVRLLGMAGQLWVSSGDAEWSGAVWTWSVFSLAGLTLVVVGAALPLPWRTAAFAGAVALDVFAAWRAGSGDWRLYADHFAERHGLFVIIALGESLIAVGVTAAGLERTGALMGTVLLAVAATCALWMTYFGWAKDALEAAMAGLDDHRSGRFARDVYSLGHFPIICGVVGFAVASEEAVHHPLANLHLPTAIALTGGAALFVGGVGAALLRARQGTPVVRGLVVVTLIAATPLMTTITAAAALAFVAVAVGLVAVVEHPPVRRRRPPADA